MATIPVKWFDYDTMPLGAPTLSGTIGQMVPLLDAVAVNGYNVKVVQSITVAAGAGTIEFGSTGHGYVLHQVIKIEGAVNTAYNGEWRVTAVNGTSIVVNMTGVGDGSVGGVLIANGSESANANLACRVAPLGWLKAFSGTNKAAYKSQGLGATGMLLRVDDSVATYAKVRGYETLSDMDTGTGMFPTTTQRADTASNWPKSAAASTTTRRWSIIGDDRFLYVFVHTENSVFATLPNNRSGVAFGDFISYKEGDMFNAVLFSLLSTSGFDYEASGNILHRLADISATSRAYIARAFSQLGGAIDAYLYGSCVGIQSGISPLAYPNPADNSLNITKGNFIIEPDVPGEASNNGNGQTMRGELPGYYACMQHRPLSHGDLVDNVVAGRVLFTVGVATATSENSARFMLDITGPWR